MKIILNDLVKRKYEVVPFIIKDYLVLGRFSTDSVIDKPIFLKAEAFSRLKDLIKESLSKGSSYKFKGSSLDPIPSGDLTEYSQGRLLYLGESLNNIHVHVGINSEKRRGAGSIDIVGVYNGGNSFSIYLQPEEVSKLLTIDEPQIISPYEIAVSFNTGSVVFYIERCSYVYSIDNTGESSEKILEDGALVETSLCYDIVDSYLDKPYEYGIKFEDEEDIVFDLTPLRENTDTSVVDGTAVKEVYLKKIVLMTIKGQSGEFSIKVNYRGVDYNVNVTSYSDYDFCLIDTDLPVLLHRFYDLTTFLVPKFNKFSEVYEGTSRYDFYLGDSLLESLDVSTIWYNKFFFDGNHLIVRYKADKTIYESYRITIDKKTYFPYLLSKSGNHLSLL